MKALRALPLLLCLSALSPQAGCLRSSEKQTVYAIPGPVPSQVTIREKGAADIVVIVETRSTLPMASGRGSALDAKRSKAAAHKALARHLGATEADTLVVAGLVELDIVEKNCKLTTTYCVPRSGCRLEKQN